MAKTKKKENLWNIPNILSFLRIFMMFVVVYLVAIRANIWHIVIAFAIGMITDFFDGEIARDMHQRTEIGRNLDMIADRIFYITVMVVIFIEFLTRGLLNSIVIFQFIIVMSREILAFPFAAYLVIFEKKLPHAKFIGKLTTFMQGITVPVILLGIFFKIFSFFSIYLAIITGISGIIAAITFMIYTIKGE